MWSSLKAYSVPSISYDKITEKEVNRRVIMKISIIGAGKMGTAIIKGLINNGQNPKQILVKTGHYENALNLRQSLGITAVQALSDLATSDIYILATPATLITKTLSELSNINQQNAPIISVAAGVSFDEMLAIYPNAPLLRCIPNTPVAINQGMTSFSTSSHLSDNQKTLAINLLNQLGHTIEVPEDKLGIAGTIAGCSPAFIDVFIEALSDAAVTNGLDRALSYEIITEMMKGSAALAAESKIHPGILKDDVTSPGGDTIKGVVALEKK